MHRATQRSVRAMGFKRTRDRVAEATAVLHLQVLYATLQSENIQTVRMQQPMIG